MEKYKTNHMEAISRISKLLNEETYHSNKTEHNASLALPKTSVLSANLQELDETVKAMMETSENMIVIGKDYKRRAKICKVCGKEGHITDIKRHIEYSHLEGVSVPCNLCDKIFKSRNALSVHISKNHKNID